MGLALDIMSGKIAIITVYIVCNSTISSTGEKTAVAIQYRSLMQHVHENKRTEVHPHHHLILDLHAWISHLQSDDTSIILLMDNNEDILQHNGSFNPLHYTSSHIHSPTHYVLLPTLCHTYPPTYI
jgi:tRNA pseudouridine-54 N-methylase